MRVQGQVENYLVTISIGFLFWLNLHFVGYERDSRFLILLIVYLCYTHFFRINATSLSCFSILTLFLFREKMSFEFIPILGKDDASAFPYFYLVLGSIFFLAFLSTLVQKLPGNWKQPLVLAWFYYILLPFLVRVSPISDPERLLLKELWLLVGHCWWYFIFLVQDSAHCPGSVLTRIGFLFPANQFIVFQRVLAPFALGPEAFRKYRSEWPLRTERKKCILFLMGTIGFTAPVYFQRRWAPSIPSMFDYTNQFFTGELTFGRYLYFGLVNFVLAYFKLFGSFNLMVSLFRMGGHHYPASTSLAAFRSRDFSEFFSNIVHYAKEIYGRLFFYPTFLSLHRISNTELRTVLTTFISLCFGGTLFFASFPVPADKPFFDKGYFHYLIYGKPDVFVVFVLLAAVISYSQWRRIRNPIRRTQRAYSQVLVTVLHLSFLLGAFYLESLPRGFTLFEIIKKFVERVHL